MGRFEIIQIHNQPLRCENSPLVIKRYVITDDRLGDRLIAHVKLENTGNESFKAVKLLCSTDSESCLLSFDGLNILPQSCADLQAELSISRSDNGISISLVR